MHNVTGFIHRVFRRKNPPRKKPRIVVTDESGRVVFKGRDRRQHNEQVFFDSRESQRRFLIDPAKVSDKRRRELEKVAPQKILYEKASFPSTRSSKHLEKKK